MEGDLKSQTGVTNVVPPSCKAKLQCLTPLKRLSETRFQYGINSCVQLGAKHKIEDISYREILLQELPRFHVVECHSRNSFHASVGGHSARDSLLLNHGITRKGGQFLTCSASLRKGQREIHTSKGVNMWHSNSDKYLYCQKNQSKNFY